MSANRNIKNNAIINTKQLLKFNTKSSFHRYWLVFFYFDTILIFSCIFFFFSSLFFVVLSFACFTQSSFHLLNNIEMRLLTNSFALQQILFYSLCNSINNCPFFCFQLLCTKKNPQNCERERTPKGKNKIKHTIKKIK